MGEEKQLWRAVNQLAEKIDGLEEEIRSLQAQLGVHVYDTDKLPIERKDIIIHDEEHVGPCPMCNEVKLDISRKAVLVVDKETGEEFVVCHSCGWENPETVMRALEWKSQ